MNFTTSQEAAITTTGQNILVSASAGSGKTRVLVERVIRRLLAGENVNTFLIVTFTEAAAAEMKERLEGAIRGALAESEGEQRQHLLKQLRLLNVANISTLHAFALRLIEQYHYTIDLDPQFRLSDDAERTLLMMEVYGDLLEQRYAEDPDQTFAKFAAQFASGSTDDRTLQESVFTLFNFAMARPDTTAWLESLADDYEIGDDFASSNFFKTQLLPTLQSEMLAINDQITQLVNQAPDTMDEPPAVNRLLNIQNDANAYGRLLTLLQDTPTSWDDLRQAFAAVTLMGWGKGEDGKGKNFTSKHDPELKAAWEPVKAQREQIKERFEKLQENYFALDAAGMQLAIGGAGEVIKQLVDFTQSFREAFLTEKLRRKVLDFNDLEHFALQIVSQPAVAAELQARYNEVMVDEYQDTNQLQEAILSQIATGDNTFQVGDIKQSIYKFRQADPTLFGHKLTTYPKTDGNTVITLQENFRSQPNVTDYINYIFAQVMSEQLGDVEYAGEAELVAGADYYPADLPKEAQMMVYLDQDDADDAEEDEPDVKNEYGFTKATGQIRMMALKIKELMDTKFEIFDRKAGEKRPVRYSDMTVLVPTKNQNLDVLDIFREMDIPIVVNGAENYFQTTEISVMMSLLQVIDNPHQDIPLAAVLRSPLYGIDENGLALIRTQAMEDDFFTAVKALANNPLTISVEGVSVELVNETIAAVQRFLADLETFRTLAVQNQIVDLLWQIYNTTGWLDYVGGLPSGPQRQANLHALYERAAMYQKSSFVGLYQFINYVTQLQTQDKDLGEADANVASDSVSLMTIHRSKGLEFPIVFVLNSTRKMISQRETMGDVLLDAQAGAGMDYVDLEHHLKLPTPQREFVKDARIRGAFAEQLRVLYVALTRAEQHLFMVGSYSSVKALWSKWSLAENGSDWMLPDWVRLSGKSFMDLMGMALMRHPQAPALQEALGRYDEDDVVDFSEIRAKAPKKPFSFGLEIVDSADLRSALDAYQAVATPQAVVATEANAPVIANADWHQVLNFDYGFEEATRATAYQSVSEIKRLFEDPDLQAGRGPVDARLDVADMSGLRLTDETLPEPEFMQEAETRISSAAIGTATHLVLQRVDLQHGAPTRDDLRELVADLTTQGLIEERVAPLISLAKIERFFAEMPLGKQMVMHADSLEREVQFSLLLDASRLYKGFQGDEKVLVHGIIDGYFEVDGEVWLFDYKTDRVTPEDAAETLTSRYSGQLNIYAQALVAMGKPMPRRFIYAFSAEKIITLD